MRYACDANGNWFSMAHGQDIVLDSAGNTIQARRLHFQWNGAGQLSGVSEAGAVLATDACDHRWRRTHKTPQAGTVHCHHDQGGHLIAETVAPSIPRSSQKHGLGNSPP